MFRTRFFSSAKKKVRMPFGEVVPVIGYDEDMYAFVSKSSCEDPRYHYGPGLVLRSQGRFGNVDFHLMGAQLGARSPARHLWKDYIADSHTFVLIMPVFRFFHDPNFQFSHTTGQIEELLSHHCSDKNILVVFNFRSDDELEAQGPLHATFETWIRELQEQNQVAHFPVCLETGRGMEAAMDWLIEHVAAPAPEPKEKKSRSALHWLAEVGKKVLTIGATPKTPVGAL